jgi:hypothetical protein
MKVRRLPANTPGSESGSTTLRKAPIGVEYRSSAASTSRRSIFSRLT